MTQRQKSAHKNLYYSRQKGLTPPRRFASTLPAQGLCWLSSVSLLSGGLVFAQEAVDNIIPTIENSQPVAPNSVHKAATTTEAEPHTEFSQRRARLGKRLHHSEDTANSSETTPTVRISKHQVEERSESEETTPTVRISRHKAHRSTDVPTVRISRHKAHRSTDAPDVPTVRISRHKAENEETTSVRIAQPQAEDSSITFSAPPETKSDISTETTHETSEKSAKVIQPANDSQETAREPQGKKQDYNNAYIDPTDYNNSTAAGATKKYQAPDSVVVTERSSGCNRTLSRGQSLSGGACAQTHHTSRLANSHSKTVPSWLRKSVNSNLAKLSSPAEQETVSETVPTHSRSQASEEGSEIYHTYHSHHSHHSHQDWQMAQTGSENIYPTYQRLNRFIPSPSQFVIPSNVSTTTPSQFAIPSNISTLTPEARIGTLPTPVMEDHTAPRPSMVSYDFSLASVLPQVSSNSTIAYRPASGMIFPLSIPAPVTSLFGWRVHPITGDRRFHAGTDLGAPMGTPVLAAAKGQVETANWMGGYGLAVIISHNSAEQTLYGHMSQIFVHPGQLVEPGTIIGQVGTTGNSTGPHLHFEVRHLTENGWVAVDPGTQLQTALGQLVQSLRTTQVAQVPR